MSDLDALLRQLSDGSGPAWNDETYDLALAGGLSPADRSAYVARLLENAAQGDPLAILTLGHLRALEALPLLRSAAGASWAPTARRALVLLGHGPEVLEQIADDAVHAPSRMTRAAAVLDLPRIGGPLAVAALERALDDPDSAVRMLAWDGLITTLGLDPWIRDPSGTRTKTTLLELLGDLLACDRPAFARMGATELRAITGPLSAGASPESLGLAWIPDPAPEVSDQILRAIVDPDAAYPVREIAGLTGVPRRWAEASVAMGLDRPDPDPRSPEALARLCATWTLPVLEEIAESPTTSAELRASLTTAITALRPPRPSP